ncbi:MAG: hypothetical protein IAF94_21520 [Pirellulaceae bacterium]|nr:hypothetical protein [Pirellulaceae bacterium]
MQSHFTNRGKLGGVRRRSDFSCVSLAAPAGILLLLSIASAALAAGPRVDIVIGEKAPALERRAAEDVATDLKKVYEADVKIVTAAPEGAEYVIFVGSPETNEPTKKLIAENWPTLAKQDHVLRTIKHHGKSALFVGGGSPVAAYWAASEYAHSLGIRSLLYADLYPVAPKPFTLGGYDMLLKCRPGESAWPEIDPFPTGYTSWGLNDQKQRLRQLARLKQNTVLLGIHCWQPFVDFEIDGIKKQTGVLWYGWQFPVSGDTAGRAPFKGAKLFENPDFAGKATYEERLDAGKDWLSGFIKEANSLGLAVDVQTSPMEFPKEFAPILAGSAPTSEPGDLAVRSLEKRAKGLTAHERLHSGAYKTIFPGIHAMWLNDGSGDDFWLYGSLLFDHNYSAYESSRNRFGAGLEQESACKELVTPICGDGVDGSVFKAELQIDDVNRITVKNDKQFNRPSPDMILKHYSNFDPPPEWWSQVRANYLGAMNDLYRANSRAREGGRSYTLYLARRCEFGYEYMNCVEATRKAGIAKSKKDTAEQRAQLEKAVESMNAACSALAAVARDQSDRGMIAVCNEFGYKALQKEMEKLDAEEK